MENNRGRDNRKAENHENKTVPCENNLPEDDGRAFKNCLRHEAAAAAAAPDAARRGASPILLHEQ
jgi:hypothetical protein